MDPALRAFYRVPLLADGAVGRPGLVAFTDGTVIGAVLDRNGLRPSRYWVTDDDLVVMASRGRRASTSTRPRSSRKGRLQPGRMFLIDTAQGRIVDDAEIKATLAAEHPYARVARRAAWWSSTTCRAREHVVFSHDSVLRRQQVFGYTHEELKIIVAPMAEGGLEPIGSMGTDTPIAVLSDRPRLLFDYFQQLFAQVTNPPLDAIREEVVTSVASTIGPGGEPAASPGRRAAASSRCRSRSSTTTSWPRSSTPTTTALPGLRAARRRACSAWPAAAGARAGAGRDQLRGVGGDRGRRPTASCCRTATPTPARRRSRRCCSPRAVHHHLMRTKTAHHGRPGRRVRRRPRGAPHGAAHRLRRRRDQPVPGVRVDRGHDRRGPARPRRHRPAEGGQELHQGLRQGRAQGDVEDGRVDGGQLHRRPDLRGDRPRRRARRRSTSPAPSAASAASASTRSPRRWRPATRVAHPTRPEERAHRKLELGGEYQWRREGEHHLFNPETVFKLQHATRAKRYDIFKEYTEAVDDQSQRAGHAARPVRAQATAGASRCRSTRSSRSRDHRASGSRPGAMSYGSISMEAHETLAIAMNRIGGKSNTGEGGEDPERLHDPERAARRSSRSRRAASA